MIDTMNTKADQTKPHKPIKSIVGLYFYGESPKWYDSAQPKWQGQIAECLDDGRYLARLHKKHSFRLSILELEDMRHWIFYENAETMDTDSAKLDSPANQTVAAPQASKP